MRGYLHLLIYGASVIVILTVSECVKVIFIPGWNKVFYPSSHLHYYLHVLMQFESKCIKSLKHSLSLITDIRDCETLSFESFPVL